MLRPSEFRDLVSGRRKGLLAALARGVLRVAEVPYTLAVTMRNRRYDRGAAEVHNVGVPVISVGNLTLGGTGKTPMVKWLAQRFRERRLARGDRQPRLRRRRRQAERRSAGACPSAARRAACSEPRPRRRGQQGDSRNSIRS